jgi:GNAT superfamily N-acetyltransferase
MPDWTARTGSRVVVRHRLPGGGMTDVVGVLLQVTGTAMRLDGPRGVVEIPLADVVAGRRVPPRPARAGPPHLALDVAGLQTVMAEHWLPADHERLGGWLLRAAEGFTGRGNSVLAVGDPGMPLAEALPAVRRWYAERALPAIAAVPDVPGNPLRERFLADCWVVREGAGALVLTAATAGLRAEPVLPVGLRLRMTPAPDDAWLATYRYRGQPVPPIGRELLTSAPEQVFAAVMDGARTVAVARGSLALGWGGLTAVDVATGHRRQGLARALLASVAQWLRRRRAAAIYLQVADENAAALALYTDAGFTVHHRYDYLRAIH